MKRPSVKRASGDVRAKEELLGLGRLSTNLEEVAQLDAMQRQTATEADGTRRAPESSSSRLIRNYQLQSTVGVHSLVLAVSGTLRRPMRIIAALGLSAFAF
jgi:hypothetical protein